MRQSHGLFRPSGAFFRLQFSAGYTINISDLISDMDRHLGHADKKYWPQNRGFDYFYGNVVGEVDYFTRERGGLIDWQRNGKFLAEKGYYTNLIGDDAIKLIDQQDGKKPFFLYFASLAPHAPFQAPEDYVEKYKSIEDKQRRTYAAMITDLDDQLACGRYPFIKKRFASVQTNLPKPYILA
jgi:hypothetical protein